MRPQSTFLPALLARIQQSSHRARSGFAREQGASIVEMAFSMLILLAIMFGLIEACFALYTYHFISDAAREGSRYAIVHGSACLNGGVSCTATTDQIQTYVENLGFPGINPSNMTVTTTYAPYPAGGTCTPSAACNNPGNLATVTVNYNFPLSIPFVSSSVIAMSSTSSMVISQ
ncbi:MAG TPA: TadE/TadG family type IV pilus assembly protein [Acidobacteriaceae bacterium]|nr:TadE/TadG family type IV pilus assembly protein [Acidobacteriaceae bacterium]